MPFSFVLVLVVVPRPALCRITSAFERTVPVASVTRPEITATSVWARQRAEARTSDAQASAKEEQRLVETSIRIPSLCFGVPISAEQFRAVSGNSFTVRRCSPEDRYG